MIEYPSASAPDIEAKKCAIKKKGKYKIATPGKVLLTFSPLSIVFKKSFLCSFA